MTDAAAPLPVSVLVARTASGSDAELTDWAESLCREAAGMPGHLATHISRERVGERVTLRIGVTFAGAEHLLRWERSARRHAHLRSVATITEGEPVALSVADLERWGPGRTATAPSRLRTAVLIWVALLPPAVLVNLLVMPALESWHVLLRTLLLTLVLVPAVVFVTLPLLNRLLDRRARSTPSR